MFMRGRTQPVIPHFFALANSCLRSACPAPNDNTCHHCNGRISFGNLLVEIIVGWLITNCLMTSKWIHTKTSENQTVGHQWNCNTRKIIHTLQTKRNAKYYIQRSEEKRTRRSLRVDAYGKSSLLANPCVVATNAWITKKTKKTFFMRKHASNFFLYPKLISWVQFRSWH